MLALILVAMLVLFFFGLFFKEICAMCLAVSVTWMGLLFFYWAGYFHDVVLIALLVGQSIIGLVYYLRSRHKWFAQYQMPVLLTLFVMAYFVLTHMMQWSVIWLLIVVWALFILATQNKGVLKRIKDCCKEW